MFGNYSKFRMFSIIKLFILLPISIIALTPSEKQSKIHPDVIKKFNNGERPSAVIVECQPPPSPNLGTTFSSVLKNNRPSETEKSRILDNIFQDLVSNSLQALAAPLALLNKVKATYNVLWINNWIVIYNPDLPLLIKLVVFDVVITIGLDERTVKPTLPIPTLPSTKPPSDDGPDWNRRFINRYCSNIPCNGKNITIAILDAGVMWNHTELIGNWIGEPYGWFNGTGPTTTSAKPTDDSASGDGTKMAGIAVGKFVGIAPGAKWMACKACFYNGTCSRSALVLCAQWVICPWKWNDNSVDRKTSNCSKRPDIVIMGGREFVGGQILDPELFYFYPVLKLWNAYGILSVFPMGDQGPHCNSGYIPGNFEIALAIGSVDETFTVHDKSSRGPTIINKSPFDKNSTADGTCPTFNTNARKCTATKDGDIICTLIKPDLVAPGVSCNTSINLNTTAYTNATGTKIAAAHVGGAMALMKCANPKIKWNYQKAHQILVETAETEMIDEVGPSPCGCQQFAATSHLLCDVVLSQICRGFPNNLYGNGFLNVCKAVIDAMLLKE